MRIQHNIPAMSSYRNFVGNNNALSKNLEKLSSGYRINRAGDDAAGLAISEKMRAQITGLDAAQKNVKDGISLVKTAEGALQEVQDMMNRMVYLATQSANATYDNDVDRANLQKEVDALKDEINRIADSANFNGQELLNGDMGTADGVTIAAPVSNTTPGSKTELLGTAQSAAGGVSAAGSPEVTYKTSIYMGNITNTSTNDVELVFDYKDNAGNAQSITIAVSAGIAVTAGDVAEALKGTAAASMTITDSAANQGFTSTNGVDDGKFSDLYNVTLDGNTITIEAKTSTVGSVSGDTLDASKVGGVAVSAGATTFEQADKDNAVTLMQKPGAATATSVNWGDKVGEDRAGVKESGGQYILASEQLKVDNGATAASMHGASVVIDGTEYVIQQEGKNLPGVGYDSNKQVIEWKNGENMDQVMKKLADAVNATTSTSGVAATYDATNDLLTVQEDPGNSANLTVNPTKADALITVKQYDTSNTATSSTQDVTLDAETLKNGTTVTIAGQSFTFTKAADQEIPTGSTAIRYSDADTDADLAKKLMDAVNAKSITNLSVAQNGAKLTFTNSADGTGAAAKAESRGLMLQIGDTADAFNQLEVKIGDMHVDSLGTADATGKLVSSLKDIDISTRDGASAAISVIKDAINMVSSTRGDLGAIQNRLEHTTNNLSVMEENIQDAESTIRDTDMADEMTAYTKNNILVQAAQAMLAQANQLPQGVLQLLQ